MSSKTTTLALCAGAALFAAASSQAAYISYTSADRTAGLGDATDVLTGTGNVSQVVMNSVLPTGNPLDPWVERGDVSPASGGPGTYTAGILKIVVTQGNWGSSGPLKGTWTITDANFWTTYGFGAISLHAGNGQGDPDYWIWKLTNGALTGNWDYQDFDGVGGGLSNLHLFSHGTSSTTTVVSDGGASLALMGLSLLGVGLARRRFAK